MTWNYRLIRHRHEIASDTWVGIHEVFYDDDGVPKGCTENPIKIIGADRAECYSDIINMLKAFEKPVLDMQYFDDLEPVSIGEDEITMTIEELKKELDKDG